MSRPTVAPLEWQAIQALAEMLRVISVDNDYYTDAGARVLTENPPNKAPEDQPEVWVTGIPIGTPEKSRTIRKSELRMIVESRIPVGRSNAQQSSWELHADLLEAIPNTSADFPKGIGTFQIESSDIVQRPEGQPFIYVQVVLRANLTKTRKPASIGE